MNIGDIFKNISEMRGRTAMYDNEEDLRNKIVEYFEEGADSKVMYSNGIQYSVKVLTITGLCLYLGFASRSAFYKYEDKGEFRDTIKAARTFIEKEYEEQLQHGSATGAIFALKNFGWKDIQTLEGEVNDNGERKFVIEHKRGDFENLGEDGEEREVE